MTDDRRYVLLGTAGHIDHGKTALVKMLTGCDTDTLKEEKERGLTIDLGFAPCELRGDLLACIVDVPGHEKFIRNMVAGASGIDAVILVVAADDSVMPQTIEHLRIVELLGIDRGMVAVTKIDMVDEELRELAIEEVREFLQGTFLEAAPICPVSSITGEGFEGFWIELEKLVDSVRDRPVHGIFRMPVERVFSPPGFGAVITGMPPSGRVDVGDHLEHVPSMAEGRLRALQVYGKDSDSGWAGQCLALNVSGIDYSRIERGHVLAAPGYLRPATMVELRLHLLPGVERPLKHQAPVRLHTGTAEVMGRVFLLDRDLLAAGDAAFAQFRSDDPVIVAPGDRFVIRQYSPVVTIGGGRILRASRRKIKRFKDAVIEELAGLEAVLDDVREHVAWTLAREGARAVREDELARNTFIPRKRLGEILSGLVEDGRAAPVGTGNAWVSREALVGIGGEVKKVLAAFHERSPLRKGMEPTALREAIAGERRSIAAGVLEAAIEALVAAGEVERTDGALRLTAHRIALSPEEEALRGRVEDALREAGVAPPTAAAVAAGIGAREQEVLPILEMLADGGAAVRLGDGVYAHAEWAARTKKLLVDWLKEKGQIGVVDFRDLIGASRKYVYVWLDHFDRTGVTYRAENLRYLRESAAS